MVRQLGAGYLHLSDCNFGIYAFDLYLFTTLTDQDAFPLADLALYGER